MTATAQRQWTLTENESNTTFEAWKTNLMSILSLEQAFTPFLQPDAKWSRKTKTNPLRGFPGTDSAQQIATLETMLGLIANYTPVVSQGNIVKSSTSLNSVWKVLQLYYGIRSNSDTSQLSHSRAPHQQLYKPSDQTCSICKPPTNKPDHDLQYIPENDPNLLKNDPEM